MPDVTTTNVFLLFLRRRLFLLLIIALQSGCYEGWENGAGDQQGSGGTGQGTGQGGGPKPIAYLLFQPAILSAEALTTSGCVSSPTEVMYRAREYAERIAAAASALARIADTVVSRPIEIAAADCTTFSAVDDAATSASPWGEAAAPPEGDTRPIVHVRGGMTFGSTAVRQPPAVVVSRDWVAWQALNSAGRPAVSLNYFVLSDADSGHFLAEWSRRAEPASTLLGTSIDPIDPSEEGLAARGTQIKADTASLVTWVLESTQ